VKKYFHILLLIVVLFISFIVSTSLGSVNVPLKDTFRILTSFFFDTSGIPAVSHDIIVKIRIPRVFLGMFVGAALSVSGLVFQALLKNPLADPYTLGISAGASFGAALAIFLSSVIDAYFKTLLPVFAFVGAVSTMFFVYFLARTKGRVQMLTIILSGVIVSYLFSSGLVLIMSLAGDRSHEIIYWLMGSLAGFHRYIIPAAGAIFVLSGFTFLFNKDLDLIALGDERAISLGVNTDSIRLILFSTTSLITATAVSLTGTIGFVGLIIPHSMRLVFGPKHRMLIPASIISGAAFLPLSDMIGRVLPGILFGSGVEIPVGVITSLFGSPFFIFLLLKGKKKLWF